jgi:Mrp family chromosome partitioning ATPase
LFDWLCADDSAELVPRATYLDNLHVLPAGASVPGRGRPLRSARMGMLMDSLRENYEHVILDMPAILVNSDALLLIEMADSAILVVRTGITPLTQVQKAIAQVDETKLRGVVLNGAQSAIPGWMRRVFGV